MSISALARAFAFPRTPTRLALAHRLGPPGERENHSALDTDREQQILDCIQQNAEQSIPIRKTEIKDYCNTQLKVPTTRG
jgi:hypothetical protein